MPRQASPLHIIWSATECMLASVRTQQKTYLRVLSLKVLGESRPPDNVDGSVEPVVVADVTKSVGDGVVDISASMSQKIGDDSALDTLLPANNGVVLREELGKCELMTGECGVDGSNLGEIFLRLVCAKKLPTTGLEMSDSL